MKTKIIRRFVKYFSMLALFVFAVLLSAMIADAQTKARKKSNTSTIDKEFSVSCAKALRIGLKNVTKLHDADIMRRLAGEPGDSDTELLIEKNAFENYLRCRRADTIRRLKKLPADEQVTLEQTTSRARRLAEMRVNLIYGVSFDERYDDPVNYVISKEAVILVENYKAALLGIYLETGDYGAYRNTEVAARDIKQIGALLKRIEKLSLESDQADEFKIFKTTIEKRLTDIADEVGNEKRADTDFLVRLLQMNLPAEN